MALPPLLPLPDEAAYRKHFVETCVKASAILTFDGIRVRFFPEMFNHAFFRDSSHSAHDKARFDLERAKRMDWIQAVLGDASLEVYRRRMKNDIRRIALEPSERYVVVIQIDRKDSQLARFVTAYIVDSDSALKKMRSNPKW